MAGSESGSGCGRKRVSFLMPYIDFCFMLIIIFVGMLSIAYFEPLGLIDIQTQHEDEINQREGSEDVKPIGAQIKNYGPGEQNISEAIMPLSPDISEGSTQNTGEIENLKKQIELLRRQIESLKRQSGTSTQLTVDIEKLKQLEEELQKKINEIERLKEIEKELRAKIEELEKTNSTLIAEKAKAGAVDEKGNHVYIDLRSKNHD